MNQIETSRDELIFKGIDTVDGTGFLSIVAKNQCHLCHGRGRRAGGGEETDERNGFTVFNPIGKTTDFHDDQ